jgi:hypothetical protein
MKKLFLSIINKLPYISTLRKKADLYEKNAHGDPGHYYSPIFDVDDLKRRQESIWGTRTTPTVAGIDLNSESQLSLLKHFESYYTDFPFPASKQAELRYYSENRYYGYTDGLMFYFMIRHFKPSRIIEAGSGFSSALMLDMHDIFETPSLLTFIDPETTRLESFLRTGDKEFATFIGRTVQSVDNALFLTLEKNDILFIDSSHVTKTGSDVNFLLLEILPQLQAGVIIHIHDIFYPFVYPEKWTFNGVNWNETYLVKALLANSNRYKILLFSDYIHLHHPEAFEKFPITDLKKGQSIWLQVL